MTGYRIQPRDLNRDVLLFGKVYRWIDKDGRLSLVRKTEA